MRLQRMMFSFAFPLLLTFKNFARRASCHKCGASYDPSVAPLAPLPDYQYYHAYLSFKFIPSLTSNRIRIANLPASTTESTIIRALQSFPRRPIALSLPRFH